MTTRAATEAAHARLFLELAEAAAPHFSGAGQVEWRDRLELDHDNLRAAFVYFLADPDGADEALRFGSALGWFWSSRGSYGEGIELIQAALRRPDAAAPTARRAEALSVGGHLLCRCGDVNQAQATLEEALLIARRLSEPALTADALRNLAWVADRRGACDEAIMLATEAVEHASRSGESHLLARAYDVRAAARQHRDPGGARSDYGTALRYCVAAEDHHGQASTLNNLAVLELEQGNHDEARRHFARALVVARQTRSSGILPYLEYGVGLAATLEGDVDAACPAFATALRVARQTGQRSLVAYAILGIAIASDEPGDEPRTAMLHGAAMGLFEQLGEAPERLEASLRKESLASLHAALGAALERHCQIGRALSGPDVITLALRAAADRPDRKGGRERDPYRREDDMTRLSRGRWGVAVALLAASTLVLTAPAGAAGGGTAELSIQPAPGALSVTFVANSTGFGGPVVSYLWSFGDDQTAKTAKPTVVHTYPSTGAFTPMVTETDSAGDSASANGTLELFVCPPGPTCTEELSNVAGIKTLKTSGSVKVGGVASVDIFVGPYQIANCNRSVLTAGALTDDGFAGTLTMSVVYRTPNPASVGTTCFSSEVAFLNAKEQTVHNGALPMCPAANAVPPCVESITTTPTKSGLQATKVLAIPPGDPKVGAL